MFSSLFAVAVVALASSSTIVQAHCPCYSYSAVESFNDIGVKVDDESSTYNHYSHDDEWSAYNNVNEGGKVNFHADGHQVEKSMYCNDTSVTSISECEASDIVTLSIRTPSIPLVPGTIRGFTNLTELRVEYFEHPKLSKTFLSGQSNLLTFQISSTSLEYVDKDWFKYAPNIITLVLSKNKIRSLAPETFSYLKRLEFVHLDRNSLATLPPSLFEGNFHSLRTVYLHDNRWHCDSGLVVFMKNIRYHNVAVPSPALCSYPMQLKGLDLNYLMPDDHC